MSRLLAEWIGKRGGRVPFRDFMAAALYDPDFGYYTRHIRDVGTRGDFSTSATLDHSFLGAAVAGWIGTERKEDQWPRNLIEVGAGNGALARAVLEALGIPGRWGTRYHIVELSPPLASRQRQSLSRFRGKVSWHERIGEALDACGGEAIIFSNELVDAFPVSLYRYDGSEEKWQQVAVVGEGGRVGLDGDPAPAFEPPPREAPWTDGQLLEVHESYREWLRGWSGKWTRGSLLTIDYGDVFPEVCHRRPRGSLRAYFMQQRFEEMDEILSRFGKQDLTCDVNFTDLRAWGEACGFQTLSYSNQLDFLLQYAPRAKSSASSHAARGYLLDPDGPGGAFKVLAQRRTGATGNENR